MQSIDIPYLFTRCVLGILKDAVLIGKKCQAMNVIVHLSWHYN
jgi:hypothetical protein